MLWFVTGTRCEYESVDDHKERCTSSAAYLRTAVNGAFSGTFTLLLCQSFVCMIDWLQLDVHSEGLLWMRCQSDFE